MSDVPDNPYNPYNPYNQGNAGGPAKYCSACGVGLVAQAVICPNCGSPTRAAFGGKSKTAAVLLAVFLSPWTWLYTYRRNAWKFWVGLAADVVGLTIAISIAASYASTRYFNGYQYYQGPSFPIPGVALFFMVLGYLIPFAVWIWAIVDVSVTPRPFYQNYPTG